jgi:hypothetical protein
VAGKIIYPRGGKEAAENSKEMLHCAHGNGMNELIQSASYHVQHSAFYISPAPNCYGVKLRRQFCPVVINKYKDDFKHFYNWVENLHVKPTVSSSCHV